LVVMAEFPFALVPALLPPAPEFVVVELTTAAVPLPPEKVISPKHPVFVPVPPAPYLVVVELPTALAPPAPPVARTSRLFVELFELNQVFPPGLVFPVLVELLVPPAPTAI